jgi:hypothetical protein
MEGLIEAPAPSRQHQEREAQHYLELAILLSVPCYAWGIWVCWPKIVMDHGRLEPWKMVQWTGDVTALFWFLGFFVRRFVLLRPWRGREVSVKTARRFVWITSGSLLLGFAISLAMDFYQDHEEERAYPKAEAVEGMLLAVSRLTAIRNGTVYKLTCRFSDQQGQSYTATIPVFDRAVGGLGEELPLATKQAIRQGAVPSSISLCYDPAWPRRFWLRGVGPDSGAYLEGGYSGLSKLVMVGQVGPLVCLVLLLRQKIRSDLIPWWYQVPSFVPFMIEAVFLAIFGPIFRWGRGGG